MPDHPVISLHEYQLRPGIEGKELEEAYRQAVARGLFDLPGLVEHHLLHGIRGDRESRYAAVWIYRNRKAWEALWGPPGNPKPKGDYPPTWQTWEDELLSPLLIRDPDKINYTSYQVLL